MSKSIKLDVMRIERSDKEYTNRVKGLLDGVSKQGAQMVLRDAQALVPKRTGTLASQIKIDSGKFDKCDYFIQAQGPGNYHRYYASFVELGVKSRGIAKQPYLRPALKKNRAKITQMAQRLLDT